MSEKIIYTITMLFFAMIFISFIDNSNRHEWFSIGMLFVFYSITSFIYILVLALWGFWTIKYKNEIKGRSILEATGYSLLLLFVTLFVADVKNTIEFDEWRINSQLQREIELEKESKEYQNKLDSLNRLIFLDSNNYSAFVQRGLLKRRKGNFAESIIDYKYALKINPNDIQANYEISYSYEILKNMKEADYYYKIALKLDTNRKTQQ